MHELKHDYRYLKGPALVVVGEYIVSMKMGVIINYEYRQV